CTGDERLTCTWRSYKKNTFRNTGTDPVETARIFQEIDDFNEFLFLLIRTRDIFEAYFFLILVIELRFALAKVHHFAAASAAALCLAHQEQEEEEDKQERYEREQHACPRSEEH